MTHRTTNLDVQLRARELNSALNGASALVRHHRGKGYVLELWEGDRYVMDLSPRVNQATICHLLYMGKVMEERRKS